MGQHRHQRKKAAAAGSLSIPPAFYLLVPLLVGVLAWLAQQRGSVAQDPPPPADDPLLPKPRAAAHAMPAEARSTPKPSSEPVAMYLG